MFGARLPLRRKRLGKPTNRAHNPSSGCGVPRLMGRPYLQQLRKEFERRLDCPSLAFGRLLSGPHLAHLLTATGDNINSGVLVRCCAIFSRRQLSRVGLRYRLAESRLPDINGPRSTRLSVRRPRRRRRLRPNDHGGMEDTGSIVGSACGKWLAQD